MRQTGESERESGGNNDAERERTSESEIEDLGAQLDKACASRPLDRAQHGMTRRTAATHLLTAVLWLATAVILQYIVGGTVWVESHLRIHPLYWIAIGLLSAATAGAAAWVSGEPFLSSQAWHGDIPLLGELHLSSVLLFDLGVYMLVVGSTVLMLVAIAHQSLRSHHRKSASGAL